jgi:hypothetical protein
MAESESRKRNLSSPDQPSQPAKSLCTGPMSKPSTMPTLHESEPADDIVNKIVIALTRPEVQLAFKDTFGGIVRDMVKAEVSSFIAPLKSHITALEKTVNHLQKNVNDLQHNLTTKTDELEQYGRRNGIRIFGIVEGQEEKIDDIVINTLKIANPAVTIEKIGRCHRVGKKYAESRLKPRAIIVKFTSYRWKQEIMRNKKNFRGHDIFINDDLTKARSDLFYMTRCLKREGKIHSCWTWDGKIFVKDQEDGPPKLIRDEYELRSY